MLAEIGARVDRRAVRADSGRPPARSAPLDLPPALASEAELSRHLPHTLRQQPGPRANPDLSRRRLLAASCAGRRRRDRRAHRVPHPRLGLAAIRPRPQPGLVRVRRQLGELLNMDVVQLPVYSWGCATGHAIRMASRMTGRREVMLPRYHRSRAPVGRSRTIASRARCRTTSRLCCVEDRSGDRPASTLPISKRKISNRTAAVYFENPSYLGMFETNGAEIARIGPADRRRDRSSASIRSSSASLKPPAQYRRRYRGRPDPAARRPHELRRRRRRLHRLARRRALCARI